MPREKKALQDNVIVLTPLQHTTIRAFWLQLEAKKGKRFGQLTTPEGVRRGAFSERLRKFVKLGVVRRQGSKGFIRGTSKVRVGDKLIDLDNELPTQVVSRPPTRQEIRTLLNRPGTVAILEPFLEETITSQISVQLLMKEEERCGMPTDQFIAQLLNGALAYINAGDMSTLHNLRHSPARVAALERIANK